MSVKAVSPNFAGKMPKVSKAKKVAGMVQQTVTMPKAAKPLTGAAKGVKLNKIG